MVKNKKNKISKKMTRAVRQIAKSETLRLAETKVVGRSSENNQLYHNVALIQGPFLQAIQQGTADPTLQTNANARVGDEILLKSFSLRYWLSNKFDRPNVMYRITQFWYPNRGGAPPNPAEIYFNGGTTKNTMIARVNNEVIRVIKDTYVFSGPSYMNAGPGPITQIPPSEGVERSQIKFLTSNWKAKRIKYLDIGGSGAPGVAGGIPKNHDIYVCITAYDSWGTLTTDNISSFALDYQMSFKDL